MDQRLVSDCLMTAREAARYLAVVPRTVHRWRNRRGLPFFLITRGAIRFDRAELQRWLDRRRAQKPARDLIGSGGRVKGGSRR